MKYVSSRSLPRTKRVCAICVAALESRWPSTPPANAEASRFDSERPLHGSLGRVDRLVLAPPRADARGRVAEPVAASVRSNMKRMKRPLSETFAHSFLCNGPSYCCPRDLQAIERNAIMGMYNISSHVHLCNHTWERKNDRDAKRKETAPG